jgi:hypothetical protein
MITVMYRSGESDHINEPRFDKTTNILSGITIDGYHKQIPGETIYHIVGDYKTIERGETLPKFNVIAATLWTPGKAGMELPSRIIVLEHLKADGSVREYSRHWQADKTKETGAVGEHFFYGHYMGLNYEAALNDFYRTYNEHKDVYVSPTNPSYLAGIDFVEKAESVYARLMEKNNLGPEAKAFATGEMRG